MPPVWDELSARYFDTVFSPFDPRITNDILQTTLRASLEAVQVGRNVTILDIGCGPGNLIPVLSRMPDASSLSYVGVDTSDTATDLAESRASTATFPCRIIKADICDIAVELEADLVVAINVVLGDSRAENVRLFKAVGQCLRGQDSRAILVLPAFETALHIDELRYHYYMENFGSAHAERARNAYLRWKAPDPATASYSDDGVTRQYFHSLETIGTELPLARLEPVIGPSKLTYPWPLARYFDYGYFPLAEPVWDWLVVCKQT